MVHCVYDSCNSKLTAERTRGSQLMLHCYLRLPVAVTAVIFIFDIILSSFLNIIDLYHNLHFFGKVSRPNCNISGKDMRQS